MPANPDEIIITENAIILPVAKLHHPEMSQEEAYEAARSFWNVSEDRRSSVQYAITAYDGHVQEVYKVNSWNSIETPKGTRWEFNGVRAAPVIRNKYLGKSLAYYKNRLAWGSRIYTL